MLEIVRAVFYGVVGFNEPYAHCRFDNGMISDNNFSQLAYPEARNV